MLDSQHEPVAAEDGAVCLDVAAGEVVVLLQRHGRVEEAGGGVDHEEVAEDEVAVQELLGADGHRNVARGENTAELRPRRTAHLREEILSRGERRDAMAPCSQNRLVGLRETLFTPEVLSLDVPVLPL